MSDFHETALLRYEAEQDQLAKEEKYREENPEYYWYVSQRNPKTNEVWEDYCHTHEEAMMLVEEAVKDGYEYFCEQYTDEDHERPLSIRQAMEQTK
jgi:hypothetical protein